MSEVNFEGLLEMWQKKLARNKQFLTLVDLPRDKSELVINLYQPKHCGAKHKGNNLISDGNLAKVVQSKSSAKAFLLYSCINLTATGISSSLSLLNSITVLVLDELKLSQDMLMVVADKVKTLRIISLFAFIGDVTDESIEAVARENTDIEWFVLPGFSHEEKNWKITSKAVCDVVRHCNGLKKISMPTSLFDDQAATSMIDHLQAEKFELLDVRKWGMMKEVSGDSLKQLFGNFPKLKVEEGSILQVRPYILRKADVPLGFENIEIGQDENNRSASPTDFIQILNGEHAHMVKKISITENYDQVLKALIDKGLHNQIKELDFGIGMNDPIPKSTQLLLAKFTSIENLDLTHHLGEADYGEDYVSTNDIVKLVSKMKQLKKLDLSWSAISPKGVEKIVKTHPLLVDLNMEGCGGESYDYTDFIMGCEDLACLRRPGLKWSSRNKYGERSGMYQEVARMELVKLGMDTGVESCISYDNEFGCCDSDSDECSESDDSDNE